jgi:enoyl-CoA hydratase
MDGGLLRELLEGFDSLDRDKTIRVVVLTGAGKAFCVGADVEDFEKGGLEEMNRSFIRRIVEMEKPVIAAVNGHALGGGAELALMCDLIIASEKATFGFLGPRIGAICGYAMIRLGEEIGRAKAKELLFTCEKISPAKALEYGIINKIVPSDDLLYACLEMADKIKSISPLSVKYTKRGINRGLDGYEFRDAAVDAMLRSEDFKEGLRAFSEKRAPQFKGS